MWGDHIPENKLRNKYMYIISETLSDVYIYCEKKETEAWQ